jgi:hypothetical protein
MRQVVAAPCSLHVNRQVVAAFMLPVMACSGALSLTISTPDIPGINSPLPIDPRVEIPDDRFLLVL